MLDNVWVRSISSWMALLLNIIPVLIFFSIVSGNGGSVELIFTLLALAFITSVFAIYVNRGKSKLNIGVGVLGFSITIGITMLISFVANVIDLNHII
ncbi:hypothetical protein LCM20_15820 [Halobacillus litoralis]|uniref:hypothetical protein n=1 Tax=Halobacillus litoralis TaxID=45668 RepID=UPI001CD4CA5C|nr:hypothetical protein [Halobacillus litoralis]MCA0972075.1 hypothetical protein [Halobacillus litoralis]